jgi:hypothetical protein
MARGSHYQQALANAICTFVWKSGRCSSPSSLIDLNRDERGYVFCIVAATTYRIIVTAAYFCSRTPPSTRRNEPPHGYPTTYTALIAAHTLCSGTSGNHRPSLSTDRHTPHCCKTATALSPCPVVPCIQTPAVRQKRQLPSSRNPTHTRREPTRAFPQPPATGAAVSSSPLMRTQTAAKTATGPQPRIQARSRPCPHCPRTSTLLDFAIKRPISAKTATASTAAPPPYPSATADSGTCRQPPHCPSRWHPCLARSPICDSAKSGNLRQLPAAASSISGFVAAFMPRACFITHLALYFATRSSPAWGRLGGGALSMPAGTRP